MKKIFFLVIGCFILFGAQAQTTEGEIRATVTDFSTGAKLPGITVALEKEGIKIEEKTTNSVGEVTFKGLQPGNYKVNFSAKDYTSITQDKEVNAGAIAYMEIVLSKSNILTKVDITGKKKGPKTDIIRKDGSNGTTFNSSALKNLGGLRDITSLGNLSAKSTGFGGGAANFGGSRTNGNAVFIDGVRASSASIPRGSIEQLEVLVGGVPAMYGDFTGAVYNVTTKGPSRTIHGGIEVLSSSLTDAYNYNLVEGYLQGPLWIKNKKKKNEIVVLGYSISGNFTYAKDPSPGALGNWYLKDEVLKSIETNPLKPSALGIGYVNSAEFVTLDQMVNEKARRNSPFYSTTFNGTLKFQPTKKIKIDIGSFYAYSDVINYNFVGSLFNNSQNNHSISSSYRGFLKFTHVIKTDDKKKGDESEKVGLVSNAYYQIRFDYSQNNGLTMDAVHQDRVFDYGYIGNFTTKRTPGFELQGGGVNPVNRLFNTKINGKDTTVMLNTFYEQIGYFDTAVWFTPDDQKRNEVRSNYTKNFYEYQKQLGRGVFSLDQIRANLALINGDQPTSVYSMWTNVGTPGSGYGKSQTEQYTFFAMSEITLQNRKDPSKKHDLQFGLTYEQRFSRSWSVATTGLWSLMRQLTNKSAPVLDRNNPILSFDENGVFQDTVYYNNIVKSEGHFTQKLREHLMSVGAKDFNGNPVGPNSYLDVDQYGPEHYKLNYFSADELLNNGNSYVNYFGYDYLGNKVKGKPSFNQFLLDSNSRTIGAFQPIYMSAFIQDKFAFKDLIFRVGLRIDRYDANQGVLTDPYSLYPTKTVAEVKADGNNLSQQLNSAMEDDYTVYVNDIENPTSILGYRKTNTENNQTRWYNENGVAISDPSILATDRRNSSGRIAPYLVNNDPKQKLTINSFSDYKPQLYFMPRIWFKFPISDEAQFFVNYDVLTQRPPEGVIATIDDYYYLNNRATDVINNPALKPVRKTDYELGFKQQLSNISALSLTASYSEMRDLIQLFKYNQAYPISYTTFGNLDFGTVKGFRVEYQIKDAGANKNINLTANYMIQFADGTGSNAGSSQSLINAGQPNLRTLFPLDYDTRHNIKGIFDFHFQDGDGPKTKKGKYPLENAGINLTFQGRSGTPYTANSQPINEGQSGVVQRSQIRGTVNGARNPWQYLMDLTIDKSFIIRGKGEAKKSAQFAKSLNVYLWINNLLDIRNITRVYRYTGSAEDDGYLSSPLGQQAAMNANSSQSFIDLYTLRINNSNNYYTPRLFRVGLRYSF